MWSSRPLHDLQAHAAVGQLLLGDGITPPAGFHAAFFNGIRLQELIQFQLGAPPTSKDVVVDGATKKLSQYRSGGLKAMNSAKP